MSGFKRKVRGIEEEGGGEGAGVDQAPRKVIKRVRRVRRDSCRGEWLVWARWSHDGLAVCLLQVF